MLAVLIFALVIKSFSFPDAVIKPVNVIIKTLSVFTGVFFSVKGEKGLIKGAITGLLSVLVASLVFAIIGGAAGAPSILWEVLLGGAVGAISGRACRKQKGKRVGQTFFIPNCFCGNKSVFAALPNGD